MKIVSVVGARPQFVKHAPLSRRLNKHHESILLHTGQHYDDYMSDVFFNELEIPSPDYNLNVGSGTHSYQTGEIMKRVETILMKEKPDLVIVYGDTNSTLACALAAVKLKLRIAHIEAGLRMFDRSIPEEVNRVLTDYCSDLLFCPTINAVENLKRENITSGVYYTGDVMADALNEAKEIAEKSDILEKLGLKSKDYVLLTLHRECNTDITENLDSIMQAMMEIARSGVRVVFPAHPRTMNVLSRRQYLATLKDVINVIEPVGYLELLKLLNHSTKVLTDSGGIQKESYILKIPCITLLDDTPWPETTDDGWNFLVGSDTRRILSAIETLHPNGKYSGYFGCGACDTIMEIIGDR